MEILRNSGFYPHELKEGVTQGDCAVPLIRDRYGKILLVQDSQANDLHQRPPMQWGLVTETCESADYISWHALAAAISEEVTGRINDFVYVPGSYVREQCRTKTAAESYVRHGAVFIYQGNTKTFYPLDRGEISGYRWETLPQLYAMNQQQVLEAEVWPFVRQYFKKGLLQPLQ